MIYLKNWMVKPFSFFLKAKRFKGMVCWLKKMTGCKFGLTNCLWMILVYSLQKFNIDTQKWPCLIGITFSNPSYLDIFGTRWAPTTSYQWNYNPYKWPKIHGSLGLFHPFFVELWTKGRLRKHQNARLFQQLGERFDKVRKCVLSVLSVGDSKAVKSMYVFCF